MAESVTNRGFAVYRTLTDSYGQQVAIVQSSSAEEDAVWIQCEGTPGTPHLNREQAAMVIAGLTEFVASLDADHG